MNESYRDWELLWGTSHWNKDATITWISSHPELLLLESPSEHPGIDSVWEILRIVSGINLKSCLNSQILELLRQPLPPAGQAARIWKPSWETKLSCLKLRTVSGASRNLTAIWFAQCCMNGSAPESQKVLGPVVTHALWNAEFANGTRLAPVALETYSLMSWYLQV